MMYNNIRDYEVSVWTLQDSFITILKQSGLENREKIQDAEMVLKDDGENTFSFKIPMYLTEDTNTQNFSYKNQVEFQENPIWFNVRNGNIISGMRKIKVIFNKKTDTEKVLEFIITSVNEEHEGYSKFCEVKCHGLAFHELGKQGYSINLSEDDFLEEYEIYNEAANKNNLTEPKNNIDYWINKVLENSNWEYVICMDWSQYDGIINNTYIKNNNTITIDTTTYINDENARNELNNYRESLSLRRKDKVYNEPYVSSWTTKENSDILIANETITNPEQLEKFAFVNKSESNRYNLLQNIAEAFQVFCRFEYLYDDNYHIIGRRVIFYNNFIQEKEGIEDFTYGYNTNQITREMDSEDLISKMYIKSLTDSGTLSGILSIEDTWANPSLENYLLNFDYLYKIGTISQEQYDLIPVFQKKIYEINNEYREKNAEVISYNNQIPEIEAKLQTAKDLITEASEVIGNAEDTINLISGDASYPSFTKTNPKGMILLTNNDDKANIYPFYVTINRAFCGLHKNSLKIYSELENNSMNVKNSSCIYDESQTSNKIQIEYKVNEDNFIQKIYLKNKGSSVLNENIINLYFVFEYDPNIAEQKIRQIWSIKQATAEKEVTELTNQLTNLENMRDSANAAIEVLLEQKKEILNNFEKIMGPALREGYWQPDDEYSKYISNNIFSVSNIKNFSNNSNSNVNFIWDGPRFNEEQEFTYWEDINTEEIYPCINLSNVNLQNINNIDSLALVYRDIYLKDYTDNYPTNDPRANHYLFLNSENGCKFAYIRPKAGGNVIPVLLITGIKSILPAKIGNTTYSAKDQIKQSARLSIISYDANNNFIETSKQSTLSWINNLSNYELVYPRFVISSNKFLTTTPEKMIFNGTTSLEANKDYYGPLYNENKYYTTIKPDYVIQHSNTNYSFHYALSAGAEAIYLDAVKILKENSTPKVSYTIQPLAVNDNFIKVAYMRLGQLVHINDPELKFENVQGYISEVQLKLDKPWEDTYIIKNYKTKFEDLFSTIVAQTEAMQKQSQLLNLTASLLDNNGLIDESVLKKSLSKINLEELIKVPTELQLSMTNNKLELASSIAYKIINGETGLAFPKTDTIDKVVLNNSEGLLIQGSMQNGTVPAYFKVTNGAMGFFKTVNNTETAMLYFDNNSGDLALQGTIYANSGWFGKEDGWIITGGENKTFPSPTSSNINNTVNINAYGPLIYSKNEQVVFAAGSNASSGKQKPFIGLYSVDNNNKKTALFVFNGENLYIGGNAVVRGAIEATSLQILSGSQYQNASTYFNNIIDSKGFATTNDLNTSLNNYMKIADFVVGNGKIKGEALQTTNNGKTVISGTSMELDSNGALTFASLSGTGRLATLNMSNDGYIVLSSVGGTSSINAGSNIKIGPEKIYISTSGKLNIAAGNFQIDDKGNVKLNGTITANSGRIGQLYISQNQLYYGEQNKFIGIFPNRDDYVFAIGGKITSVNTNTGDISFSDLVFKVTGAGKLYATGADISGKITAGADSKIGSWIIDNSHIGNNSSRDNSSVAMSYWTGIGDSNLVFWAGGFPNTNSGHTTEQLAKFRVTYGGKLYASDGTVGGWTIDDSHIYSQTTGNDGSVIISGLQARSTGAWAITVGATNFKDWSTGVFRVSHAGKMYAEGAEITGSTKINTTGAITLTGDTFLVRSKSSDANSYLKFKAVEFSAMPQDQDSGDGRFIVRTAGTINGVSHVARIRCDIQKISLKNQNAEIYIQNEGDSFINLTTSTGTITDTIAGGTSNNYISMISTSDGGNIKIKATNQIYLNTKQLYMKTGGGTYFRLFISGSAPKISDFGEWGGDRILWIEVDAPSTDHSSGNFKYSTAKIYWCMPSAVG